jgi:hypothetical protein
VCGVANTREITLAVGAYASVAVPCVAVGANTSPTDSAEYLVVAQSAAGTPGYHSAFQLQGSVLASSPVVARVGASSGESRSVPVQFDRFLRAMGRSLAPRAAGAAAALRANTIAGSRVATVPAIGDSRTFQMCATLTCNTFAMITAPARIVSGHVAIYVDPAAPPGGLDSAYLDSLGQIFDQRVYAVDTAAFGRESDLDGNGVVVVLMTGVVNRMVTAAECLSSGYVAGFFQPGDLYPDNTAPNSAGEVIYTVVPDSAGTLSCPHSRARVKRVVPATMAHELQHMINFNQHVLLLGGAAEETWLDEALSKQAEELAGRTFLPADSATFLTYASGDLSDAYLYLAAPGSHYLVTTTDQILGDVGAGWLFLRYALDQFGDSLTLTRRLVQTSLTGTDNVSGNFGPFSSLVGRWALALWVSDLPAFTAPPELQYRSWQFRSTYASLHARDTVAFYLLPFPLVPVISTQANVSLSGVLRAGSGVYVRCLQPPGGGSFTLVFSAPGPTALAAAVVPQLEVVRIR